MPGQPGVEREQQVEALLGAHLADDDPARPHPQALLDQVAQRDLAGALEPGLPGLHRHPVGVREPQLEDLLGRHDPLAAGDRGGQAVEHRGLAGLGAAGDQDVEAGAHRRLEEPRRGRASGCRARPGPSSRAARSTNLRMLTAEKPRLMPSSTTCSRWPSGSIASTNGWLMSIRRPLDLSIRSTSSCTCAAVSIRLVSSCRPLRATKTRLGSLIQISSTAGSSRNGCSGPKPDTRATSSPTTASTSGTGATAPVRLRSSCSRTTLSAIRRTTTASRCGSTPSLRTSARTRSSSDSTSSTRASASVMRTPVPSQGFLG